MYNIQIRSLYEAAACNGIVNLIDYLETRDGWRIETLGSQLVSRRDEKPFPPNIRRLFTDEFGFFIGKQYGHELPIDWINDNCPRFMLWSSEDLFWVDAILGTFVSALLVTPFKNEGPIVADTLTILKLELPALH